MKEIFDNIIIWLKEHNRSILLNNLLDGNSSNEVYDKIEKETGLKIPKDLFKLYSICQGSDIKEGNILDDFHFFPGFYFMSINESILDYNVFKDDERWDVNWFPIFANGGGDFYCVDCSDMDKSPIIEFMLNYDAKIIHKNLTNMLKTINECYRKGVYFEDQNYLEADYKEERKIRKKINGYT